MKWILQDYENYNVELINSYKNKIIEIILLGI